MLSCAYAAEVASLLASVSDLSGHVSETLLINLNVQVCRGELNRVDIKFVEDIQGSRRINPDVFGQVSDHSSNAAMIILLLQSDKIMF